MVHSILIHRISSVQCDESLDLNQATYCGDIFPVGLTEDQTTQTTQTTQRRDDPVGRSNSEITSCDERFIDDRFFKQVEFENQGHLQ